MRLLLPRQFPLHEAEQLGRPHPEAAGEVKQRVQGWALLPSLQLPNVVPVVAGLVRKGVLGAPLFLPESPKHGAEGSLGAGGPSAPGC